LRGEGRGEGLDPGEFGLNGSKNAFEIAKNIVVPKSKHSEPLGNQALISYRIRGRFIMLTAVDLNDDKSFFHGRRNRRCSCLSAPAAQICVR
jgi:hypothetical protein